MPDKMPEFEFVVDELGLSLPQVLKQAGLTGSTSEALRMIEQGGVRLNGERITDKGLSLTHGEALVLQVGKRKFARVVLKALI